MTHQTDTNNSLSDAGQERYRAALLHFLHPFVRPDEVLPPPQNPGDERRIDDLGFDVEFHNALQQAVERMAILRRQSPFEPSLLTAETDTSKKHSEADWAHHRAAFLHFVRSSDTPPPPLQKREDNRTDEQRLNEFCKRALAATEPEHRAEVAAELQAYTKRCAFRKARQ